MKRIDSTALQQRQRAAELLCAGTSASDVARQVGISRQTVQSWKAILLAQGVKSLLDLPMRGRPAQLQGDQRTVVERALREGPSRHGQRTERWTLKGAGLVIERLSGVEFGASHVLRMLNELGLEAQRAHADTRGSCTTLQGPSPASNSARTGAPLISAVSRSMNILAALCKSSSGLTANELIAALAMEKSVVSRILSTLDADGYVIRSADDRYSPSLRLLSLATPYLERVGLYELCLPKLKELASLTGETVMLAVVEGERMVYLAKAEGPDNVRVVPPVGETVTLHASSVGKVWLSSLPEDRALKIAIQAGLRAVTPATLTTIDVLRKELALTRKQGFATVREELIQGASSVGVPVLDDATTTVSGALVLIAPTYRLNTEKLAGFAALLHEAAPSFAGIARINRHQSLSNTAPAL